MTPPYNWYDTHTCAPLEANPFISSVDSGNLVASLYTLHTGTLSLTRNAAAALPRWRQQERRRAQHQNKLSGPVAKLAMPHHQRRAFQNGSSGL